MPKSQIVIINPFSAAAWAHQVPKVARSALWFSFSCYIHLWNSHLMRAAMFRMQPHVWTGYLLLRQRGERLSPWLYWWSADDFLCLPSLGDEEDGDAEPVWEPHPAATEPSSRQYWWPQEGLLEISLVLLFTINVTHSLSWSACSFWDW